jgi:hypothetical protein
LQSRSLWHGTQYGEVQGHGEQFERHQSRHHHDGEELEEVTNFKYLGAALSKDGTSTAEVDIRIATATSAIARLIRIWKSNAISFPTKYKLFKSLVVSILLYGCKTWTLHANTERRIQAFEYKCLCRLLRISYLEHKTNQFVRDTVSALVGSQEPLLATVKRRKLAWFGHVTRHNSLCKTTCKAPSREVGVADGRRRAGCRMSKSGPASPWTSC